MRESEFLMGPAVFAAVVASSMMFLRMLFEVAVINPPPGLHSTSDDCDGEGWAFYLDFYSQGPHQTWNLISKSRTLSIKPALIFGALGILFISKSASIYLGRAGY